MTKQETHVTASHKGLYSALAAAQSEMGRAMKDSSNTHLKSKYADLASVFNACMPALSRHGIAILQPTFDDDTGRYVKTVLVHGESGESTECRVPLIVQKNDMQGYGSAVTYARRYGLMSMTGIAPDDDDGNAAVKAAPKAEQPHQERPKPANMSERADRIIAALKKNGLAATERPDFPSALSEIRAADAGSAARIEAEIETLKAASTAYLDDEIQY